MTAVFRHCRGGNFGGDPISIDPGVNPAASTWYSPGTPPAEGTYGYPFKRLMEFDSGRIALGFETRCYVGFSDDGMATWHMQDLASPDSGVYASECDGKVALLLTERNAWRSSDGKTWDLVGSTRIGPGQSSINNIYSDLATNGNGLWVNYGAGTTQNAQNFAYSTDDGETWTLCDTVGTWGMLKGGQKNIGWDGTQFLALVKDSTTSSPQIVSSPDGKVWTAHDFTGAPAITATVNIDYYNGLYVVGAHGVSSNGLMLSGSTLAELLAATPVEGPQGALSVCNAVAITSLGRIVYFEGYTTQTIANGTLDGGTTWTADTMPWHAGEAADLNAYVPITRLLGGSLFASVTSYSQWGIRPEVC